MKVSKRFLIDNTGIHNQGDGQRSFFAAMMMMVSLILISRLPLLVLADCYETIPKKLVQLAKEGSSSDNITVIVIYLKEPSEIAKFSWPADHSQPLDNMETTTTNDPMAVPMNENAFGSYNFENSNQVRAMDEKYLTGLLAKFVFSSRSISME